LDAVRGEPPARRPVPVPALVVAGDRDPLLPVPAAAALAASLAADHVVVPGAAHWPILAPAWQRTVAEVHRWLVRRLGESLLDFYAEAMAERDTDADDD